MRKILMWTFLLFCSITFFIGLADVIIFLADAIF
jgi:hypothetical protein